MTLDEFLALPMTQRRAAVLTTEERVRLVREFKMRAQNKTRPRAGNFNHNRSSRTTLSASRVISIEEWRKCRNK